MEKFVLVNYEQYSSTVKDFRVFGSLKYPTDSWKLIGNFTVPPPKKKNHTHTHRTPGSCCTTSCSRDPFATHDLHLPLPTSACQARPGQGDQVFALRSAVRYLKFVFLTHHGAEYYCTLSQIRVHGTTVIAEAHEDLQTHALELEQIHALIGSSQVDAHTRAFEIT